VKSCKTKAAIFCFLQMPALLAKEETYENEESMLSDQERPISLIEEFGERAEAAR
jgi:hypothetical protein